MARIWLLLDFLVLVAAGQIVYPDQYAKMTVVTSRAPVFSGQPANYPALQTVSYSQSVQTDKQSNQKSTLQSGIAPPEPARFNPTTQLPLNPSVSPTANSTASSLENWNNHVSCYQFVICMFSFIFACSATQTTENKINCKFL